MQVIQEGLRDLQHLVIEAANGAGKTISVLAQVLSYVKAYNDVLENTNDRLKNVYLTRTNNQSDRVIEELYEINEECGTTIKGISKRGRKSMCSNDRIQESHK